MSTTMFPVPLPNPFHSPNPFHAPFPTATPFNSHSNDSSDVGSSTGRPTLAVGPHDSSTILSGRFPEYVVTHPGQSQYTQAGGGVSACGLAALNCARIILGVHATGLGSAELVHELLERRFLEVLLIALGCYKRSLTDDTGYPQTLPDVGEQSASRGGRHL